MTDTATLKCPEPGCDYTSPEPADPPECPTHEKGLVSAAAPAPAPEPVEDAGAIYRDGYDDGYAAAVADLNALDAQGPAPEPEAPAGEVTSQIAEAPAPEGTDPAPFVPAE